MNGISAIQSSKTRECEPSLLQVPEDRNCSRIVMLKNCTVTHHEHLLELCENRSPS